jgi:hypothetical protein
MRTIQPSAAMEAGSTFHNLCESYYKNGVEFKDLCESLPEERRQYFDYVLPAFILYTQREKTSGYNTIIYDDSPAIEVEFSIILSPNVTYKGKVDRIAERDGVIYFLDWKFTSSYLNDYFFSKFEISPQVLSYSYIGERHFPSLGGFVIDAISIAKSGKLDTQKRFFPLLPVMNEFVSELLAIAEFIDENSTNEEAFMHNRCSCITKYNKRCMFFDVCLTKPSSRERILNSSLYVENKLIYDEVKSSSILVEG